MPIQQARKGFPSRSFSSSHAHYSSNQGSKVRALSLDSLLMNGTFILSLDTEIAWGTDPEYLPVYAQCFDNYRVILPRLVALLDRYEIPATWAVVGHLFLKPDDPRSIKKSADKPDWYHGADVIEAIRSAKVRHEIGTHTFSHIYTEDATTTREVWNRELQTCVDLHREHGLPLKSLVYPRNQVAFVESLPDYGIIAYRGIEQSWYRKLPMQRPLHLLDRALGLPPTRESACLAISDGLRWDTRENPDQFARSTGEIGSGTRGAAGTALSPVVSSVQSGDERQDV